MSKEIFTSGRREEDHLSIQANTNDPAICVYIDYLSGTENFTRVSCELDHKQQIELCKALYLNIKRWEEAQAKHKEGSLC